MRCVKCGQEIQGVNVCPYCGTNQVQPVVQPTNQVVNAIPVQPTTVNQQAVAVQPVVNQEQIKTEQTTPNVETQAENTQDGVTEAVVETNKKSNNLFYIIFAIVSFAILAVFIYIVIQYFNPKISIYGMKNEYTYSEFVTKSFTSSGSMFIKNTNTEWFINGYKFAEGAKVDYIPVVIGENTLKINNKGASNTYYFTITNDSSLLTEGNYAINTDYLDFDGDGISNIVETEKGTSPHSIDTDGDGLYDNVEMIMGLDPKTKSAYDEVREYKVVQDNDKANDNYVMVTAKGNVANTYLDTVDINVGFSSTFIQSDTLKVTTTNSEKPDNMTIYFDKESTWNLEDYKVYMFNEASGELKELVTKISDNYLIATIEDFDNIYFVGKKSNAPREYLNQIIILIDNSGSMFKMEYVTSNPNANRSSYEHDSDFKRLDLMNDLVDQLGTDNYEYSVYAFTASHCEMIRYSNNADEIKKSINSLRTECQNFNGTDMSGSIKKYASTFKENVYGAKYIIALTDGIDTGNNEFNLSEYYLKEYRKQGIHIITLGLSSDVNSDYLMDIAYLTKGKYLFASDANMLDSLSEIIESSINKPTETTTINDKEYRLIADSGFQVDRDGFSFENFGSTDSNMSNSYGFSYLAKQLYLNKVFDENGKSDIVTTKLTNNNTKRMIKGNVYNIKLTDEYNELLYNSDEYIDLTSTNNEDDDYQLLQVINQAFKVQSKVYLTKLNDYSLKHFQGQFFDYDTDLTKMIDELQSGSPAILSLSSSAGNHSVLATKIYKAVGTDEYVITVYDSNKPGEERNIYLTRSTAYYPFANSSYYTLSYNESDIEFTNMLYVDQYR